MSSRGDKEAHSTRVHVFGKTLTIKGSADEAYLQQLTAYVTSHMERLSQESPLTPLSEVAILASVNIANELFELRERNATQAADLDHRTRELLANIEAECLPVRPNA